MGCDIHLHAEVQDTTGWRKFEPPAGGPDASWGSFWTTGKAWYGDRDYDVFAVLADVRNGAGFAGIRTGGGFVPIDDPRGLPADVSDEVESDATSWGDNGHSHSWLTLAEVLHYDYDQVTTHARWVDLSKHDERARQLIEDYFKQQHELPEWATKDQGWGIPLGVEDMPDWKCYDVQVPYHRAVATFLLDMLRLYRVAGKAGYDPRNVRIVFWFDN